MFDIYGFKGLILSFGIFIIFQIWMLTGDKLETATCIAKSSHLVSRNQDIHVFKPVLIRSVDNLNLKQSGVSGNALWSNWKCFVFLWQVSNRGEAHLELNAFRRKHDCALVISGDSLEVKAPEILWNGYIWHPWKFFNLWKHLKMQQTLL